ncbi:MAG TPA: sigma-70 family RNA polymerase sigma factor [Chryseosolibacter sp.]|jgi:DNA-directed RNA polymerase specialized sigma subunit, sigma24 homolog
MAMQSDEAFLLQVNANLGIAHKVCRLYFDAPDDREDALQEMMYQLWRSYANFGGRAKFSTWMYSVCLRTALTYTFVIAVLSCAYAIYSENKKSFIKPLAELKAILGEFA